MFLNYEYMVQTFFLCLKAVPVTINITFVSFVIAFVPALGIALCRIKKINVIAVPGKLYVSFIRGTPIVLHILVVYSLIPSFLSSFFKVMDFSINVFNLNPILYAYIVFSLNSIATLSEIFRSALITVNRGQYEAGLSVGLTGWQTFMRIIFPQAAVSAIPNICTFIVTLIKNTSLAFMMTVKDITAVAKIEASYGYNYIESYIDIFFVYIIVCASVQFLFRCIEKKLFFCGIKGVQDVSSKKCS
ncbi:MAG: amino acid ABC transporter permease [Treponema sp.]|nr:amino acid ABC transporter permease [Treponema sp.]